MSSPPSLPIYLFTFNCARLLITPSILATHLFSALDPSSPPPEIIAIGLQEFAPISYSFLRGDYLSPYLDQWSSVPHLAAQYLHSTGTTNQNFPFEYVELGRYTIGMTALFIYARRSERVKNLRFGSVGFGVWGMANKGAVAARFGYSTGGGGGEDGEEEEEINVTIVSTHLSAHEHCCTDRNRDWETLARGIIFETTTQTAPVINITSSESTPLLSENISTTTDSSSSPVSGIYHPNSHLLVMGDLNYRTSHTSPTPEDFQSFPKRTDHFNEFFKRDQLTRELTAGNTLHGLVEAPITFPPTYKYLEDVLSLLEDAEEGLGGGSSSSSTRGDKRRKQSQEDIFDWSPNRWPSWCDRILWLPANPSSPSLSKEEGGGNDIKVHRYTSIPAIRFSDHKPVGLHISLPRIKTPKTVIGGEGDNNNRDLRLNPPFPLDRDWKVKRYNAETREWIVGYAILMATTTNGLTILGCMAIGLRKLKLEKRPKLLSKCQAIAAIGQCELVALWDKLFSLLGQPVAQVLLTRNDIVDRQQYINAANTFSELLSMGVIPIVNENDTLAVSEIKFGDNDTLSGITAGMVNADYLFLMTDVDCLYDKNPRLHPDAKPIMVVDDVSSLRADVSTAGSAVGTGGMATKLIAAKLATSAGVTTIITRSSVPSNIFHIVNYCQSIKSQSQTPVRSSSPPLPHTRHPTATSSDDPISTDLLAAATKLEATKLSPSPSSTSLSTATAHHTVTFVNSPTPSQQTQSTSTLVGTPTSDKTPLKVPLHTRFLPRTKAVRDRHFWLLHGLKPHGTLYIDQGAYNALTRSNRAGLLPVGVVCVHGEFHQLEAVSLTVLRKIPQPQDAGERSPSPTLDDGSPVRGYSVVARDVGRAIVNYSSLEIQKIKGMKSSDIKPVLESADTEYISHRDNTAFFPKYENPQGNSGDSSKGSEDEA